MLITKISYTLFSFLSLGAYLGLKISNSWTKFLLFSFLILLDLIKSSLKLVFFCLELSKHFLDLSLKCFFVFIALIHSTHYLKKLLFLSFNLFQKLLNLILEGSLFWLMNCLQWFCKFLCLVQTFIIQFFHLFFLLPLAVYLPGSCNKYLLLFEFFFNGLFIFLFFTLTLLSLRQLNPLTLFFGIFLQALCNLFYLCLELFVKWFSLFSFLSFAFIWWLRYHYFFLALTCLNKSILQCLRIFCNLLFHMLCECGNICFVFLQIRLFIIWHFNSALISHFFI